WRLLLGVEQSFRGLRALGTRSTKGWQPRGCRAAEWCCARPPIQTTASNSREERGPTASRCERLVSGLRRWYATRHAIATSKPLGVETLGNFRPSSLVAAGDWRSRLRRRPAPCR